MQPPKESDPRRGKARAAEIVSRGSGRGQSTAPVRPGRERFVSAHRWTVAEVETAIATADARQLVRALDLHPDAPSPACHCPQCRALRSVTALGRWHWSCDECQTLGSWLALRQPCALSVECCLRLAAIVHGVRSEVAA